MNSFTLYDLSVLAHAVDQQRKKAMQEYKDRMEALDRLSDKIRNHIDTLNNSKCAELHERDFFNEM